MRHFFLDKQIKISELGVLKKLKNNKVPGLQKITKDYYKHLPYQVKRTLVRRLNKIHKKEVLSEWSNAATREKNLEKRKEAGSE